MMPFSHSHDMLQLRIAFQLFLRVIDREKSVLDVCARRVPRLHTLQPPETRTCLRASFIVKFLALRQT
jgi:hypothetical protein